VAISPRPGRVSLPIDPRLPEIVAAVRSRGALVLEAEPGAGKTTRVPPALLDAFGDGGEIWVLEPRRIAARLAAVRVAEERGERLGEAVGYQVRHESIGGPSTRLRFLTEGVFGRRLQDDPTLGGVSVLVLDEFHERHLHGDLALAMARRLRDGDRPDLKVVVMSATLETAPVAAHLGDVPIVRAEGRTFPVEIAYAKEVDDRPLPDRVAAAVRRTVRASRGDPAAGDLLVFLPGAGEIRRARDILAPFAREVDVELVPLHGALPAAEQDRAVREGPRRKVVLATNVAETSVTLPSVTHVIDTGLARVATHAPWSGLPHLEVRPIARASAIQRAGRAGRVGPGHCLRLYGEHDFLGRAEHVAPEIVRSDLSDLLLGLSAAGIEDPAGLPWLDPPPEAALRAARTLLARLGALDEAGHLTPTGAQMARLPVHPRQARLLVEAERRNVHDAACTVAALAGERDILARGGDLRTGQAITTGPCDLLERLDRMHEASPEGGGGADRARRLGLDPGAVRAVAQSARQLRRLGASGRRDRRPKSVRETGGGLTAAEEEALRLCILAAWPDRVARRRRPGQPELVLAEGGEVRLSPASVVQDAEWIVAVDATRHGATVVVHRATAIEPDWLLDLFPERIAEGVEVTWNAKARRVEAFSRMTFGEAVLTEGRERAADRPEAWKRLAEEARRAGLSTFADPAAIDTLAGRLQAAAEAEPAAGFPSLDEAAIDAAIDRLCEGRSRFDELSTGALVEALLAPIPWEVRSRIDSLAPTHVALPGRKRAPVHYPKGAPPYVASRIQDFFGLAETPRIGEGRVPLVVHLLAPNNRPVQVTSDLAGFWERHYPGIRKALSRRYPRHAWPEIPPGPAHRR
jgi:ATP-dependent helicase HrpB